MHISRRRLLLIAAIAAIAMTPLALESVGAPVSLGLGVAVAAGVAFVAMLLRTQAVDQAVRARRAADASRIQYQQLEALASLLDYLKPRAMLPPTRGWAASPDLLRMLCQQVEDRRPEHILELGSGVSTLVLAYCLERQGSGKLVSLEHDSEMAARTRRWLARHGLEAFAEVKHAPIVTNRVADEEWPWYDVSQLESGMEFDVLLVDGPPATLRTFARYPALPLLQPMLAETATIVLDDGGRVEESEIAKRWCRENPGLDAEYQDLEKGAFVLRWSRG